MDPLIEPHFTEQLKQQQPYWQTKELAPSGKNKTARYSPLVFKNCIIVIESITYSLSLHAVFVQRLQNRES